jgi:YD repeat-containing protein
LLSKITYPDGGFVSYTYTLNPLSEFESFQGESGTLNGCFWHHDTPAVGTRSVSFDGTTIALRQTFTYSTTWSSNPSWSSKTTTVTTTDNVSGLTYSNVYTCTPYVAPRQPNDYSQYAPQIPVESTIVTKNSQGTTQRTVQKIWANQFELLSLQTTLEDGSTTSKTTYTYGSGAQVTQQKDYDWGVGAPGVLLRQTTTNYQAFVATAIFPAFAYIFDRPCQSIVYDGGGNRMAETDYFYDNGGTGTVRGTAGTSSVTAVNGLPSGTHDETNYSASSRTCTNSTACPRGNVTTKTRKCFVGSTACTDSITTYAYDATGQVLSVTDPCGNGTCGDMTGTAHTTTYSYADNYTQLFGGQNVTYTPTAATNAFLTTTTDPLGHTASFSYDFWGSELTSSSDANSQTTKYLYTDSQGNPEKLGRLGETDYPDSGKTTVVYNDVPLSVSVTQTRLVNPGPNPVVNITTVSLLDGMGHVTQSQLATDPGGTTYTDTTYDGQNHVHTKSNPHRSGRAPTDGTTAFTYDVLGRTTKVSEPDGSSMSMSYSLNNTTVTDEIGDQHKTQTDALGRLTYVWEAPNVSGMNYETDYAYDPLSNLQSVTQRGGTSSGSWRVRTFTYDSFSRLLCAANPEVQTVTCPTGSTTFPNGAITYTYDLNGNLASKLAPQAGQTGTSQTTTNYTYDVLNRLTTKSYLNPNTGTVFYAYDGGSLSCPRPPVPSITSPTNLIGRRSAMCSGFSASAWSYDPMGRVLVDKRTNSGSAAKTYATSYAYYKDGSLNTLTYPSGGVVTYVVGGAGRVTQVSGSKQ